MRRVQGEFTESTLPVESSILIDRSETQWGDVQFFVLRAAEGMVVKQTVRGEGDGWQFASDQSA